MKKCRRCASCGSEFLPRVNVPNQRYCSSPECQRERRYEWHKQRLACDTDYRENQRHAQAAWQSRHPTYWKDYRESHPDYCTRNRDQQQIRNARKSTGKIAKIDESLMPLQLPDGVYRLSILSPRSVAQMDAYLVRIAFLSSKPLDERSIAKR